MTDPNSPDDTLPPEYQDTAPPAAPVVDVNDVAYQAEQALAPGGIADQTKAAVEKLAADEKAIDDDPKVKVALVIDRVRALLDEIEPVLGLVPIEIGMPIRTVIITVDGIDDLLAKVGL